MKFKDKRYFYWTKTTAEGNYGKKLRQLIDGSKSEEVIFDGDIEKKNTDLNILVLELLMFPTMISCSVTH